MCLGHGPNRWGPVDSESSPTVRRRTRQTTNTRPESSGVIETLDGREEHREGPRQGTTVGVRAETCTGTVETTENEGGTVFQ